MTDLKTKGWDPKTSWKASKTNDVQIKLHSPHSKIPTRATSGSAGYDIYSVEAVSISPGSRMLVDSGFSIQFPNYVYARIAPRSGLSVKYSIDVGAGVIDSDYTGIVKVLLINNGTETFSVNVGDRIAQMLFERVEHFNLMEVSEINSSGSRGNGGFGSTGV